MPGFKLSPKARKMIMGVVDSLFERAKTRLLGPAAKDKTLRFTVGNVMSLPDLFEQAVKVDGTKPDTDTLDDMLKIVDAYMNSHKERAKARVLKEVTATLNEAWAKGEEIKVKDVLKEKISDIWQNTTTGFKTILEVEANSIKNAGLLDGVVSVNMVANVEDPTVGFLVVHDNALCVECKRLHLMPDGVTPRLWKMSQLSHGYHEKGENTPSVAGEHPNCRCQLFTVLPGWGLDVSGKVTYISPGFDAYAEQNR